MKFTTVVAFAAGALAAKPVYMEPSLTKRQGLSQVESDVAAISSAAAGLDSSIKAFSGISDSAALISASQAIVTAIKKATTDAGSLADNSLSVNQALPLATPIQALGDEVTTTVNDLIAKKSAFAALNLCGEVLQQVQAQQAAATAFQTAVIAKLDASAKSVGQSLAAPILASLNSAASAFQSCPASSSSPTSSAPSTSSSTSTGTAVPPGYTTSSTGSFVSTSTSVATKTANGTAPISTGKPTVVPNANGAVQQVVGFGGLVAAALFAVAL